MPTQRTTAWAVGQLIIGGFAGESLPSAFARALADGRRGGAILFKRNLSAIADGNRLCTAIVAASPVDAPPFIGIDQEGGRVARLPSPALRLPPMQQLAACGQLDLVEAAGAAVGAELAALGCNLNFAPVLDVNTEPTNPVIGDRAFGADPQVVAANAVAYLRGLQRTGVMACGKHFPGHGDTRVDSHFALPVVHGERARLSDVELVPFRAAIAAGVAALMSAHVVYTSIDATAPATLSPRICTTLLRDELGFRGALFSDDLEMKALAARGAIEEVAVQAVRAGCDALLVCSDEAAQERVYDALRREAEVNRSFGERCCASADRLLALRRAYRPQPVAAESLADHVGGRTSAAFARRLEAALAT